MTPRSDIGEQAESEARNSSKLGDKEGGIRLRSLTRPTTFSKIFWVRADE
jgi:hypothetical protein